MAEGGEFVARKKSERVLEVIVKYAEEPDAPTLAEVQQQAAPLVARLFAEVYLRRIHQKEQEVDKKEQVSAKFGDQHSLASHVQSEQLGNSLCAE